MAMTPTERKRRSRQKKAQEAKLAGDPIDSIATVKFNMYLPSDGNWQDVLSYLEWAGVNPDAIPAFDNDKDPDHNPSFDGPYRGSIGRAERLVGALLDAAVTLAGIINTYKREQIEAAITQLLASELADPAKRKNALIDIVRLSKLRDRLNKQVRRSLPEWRTKEV